MATTVQDSREDDSNPDGWFRHCRLMHDRIRHIVSCLQRKDICVARAYRRKMEESKRRMVDTLVYVFCNSISPGYRIFYVLDIGRLCIWISMGVSYYCNLLL